MTEAKTLNQALKQPCADDCDDTQSRPGGATPRSVVGYQTDRGRNVENSHETLEVVTSGYILSTTFGI